MRLDHSPRTELLEDMGWRDPSGPNVFDMEEYKIIGLRNTVHGFNGVEEFLDFYARIVKKRRYQSFCSH